MRHDDVRFVTAPVDRGMWELRRRGRERGSPATCSASADDVRFRRAERLYVRGHLTATTFAEEKARLAARGGAVELLEQTDDGRLPRLAARAGGEPARDPPRRGCARGAGARTGAEPPGRAARSRRAPAQQAGADEPRFNLEVLLTALRPNGLVGRDLSQNQAGVASGVGAGLATPEEGY